MTHRFLCLKSSRLNRSLYYEVSFFENNTYTFSKHINQVLFVVLDIPTFCSQKVRIFNKRHRKY